MAISQLLFVGLLLRCVFSERQTLLSEINSLSFELTFVKTDCVNPSPNNNAKNDFCEKPCPANCLKCDNEIECSMCEPGYLRRPDNACIKCPLSCLDCTAPNNWLESRLVSCGSQAYILSLEKTELIQCPNGCSNCYYANETMVVPPDGFISSSDALTYKIIMECNECSLGWALTFFGSCEPCQMMCSECNYCKQEPPGSPCSMKLDKNNYFRNYSATDREKEKGLYKNICTKSNVGYVINPAGLMMKCGENCSECQFDIKNNIPRCTKCSLSSTSFNLDGISCMECPENCTNCFYGKSQDKYTLKPDFQPITLAQAKSFGYLKLCDRCKSSYYIDFSGYCSKCPNLCSTCGNYDGDQYVDFFSNFKPMNFKMKCLDCLEDWQTNMDQIMVINGQDKCELININNSFSDTVRSQYGCKTFKATFDQIKKAYVIIGCQKCKLTFGLSPIASTWCSSCKNLCASCQSDICDTCIGGAFLSNIDSTGPICLSQTEQCSQSYFDSGIATCYGECLFTGLYKDLEIQTYLNYFYAFVLPSLKSKFSAASFMSSEKICKACEPNCKICKPAHQDSIGSKPLSNLSESLSECLVCEEGYSFDFDSKRCIYCPNNWSSCSIKGFIRLRALCTQPTEEIKNSKKYELYDLGQFLYGSDSLSAYLKEYISANGLFSIDIEIAIDGDQYPCVLNNLENDIVILNDLKIEISLKIKSLDPSKMVSVVLKPSAKNIDFSFTFSDNINFITFEKIKFIRNNENDKFNIKFTYNRKKDFTLTACAFISFFVNFQVSDVDNVNITNLEFRKLNVFDKSPMLKSSLFFFDTIRNSLNINNLNFVDISGAGELILIEILFSHLANIDKLTIKNADCQLSLLKNTNTDNNHGTDLKFSNIIILDSDIKIDKNYGLILIEKSVEKIELNTILITNCSISQSSGDSIGCFLIIISGEAGTFPLSLVKFTAINNNFKNINILQVEQVLAVINELVLDEITLVNSALYYSSNSKSTYLHSTYLFYIYLPEKGNSKIKAKNFVFINNYMKTDFINHNFQTAIYIVNALELEAANIDFQKNKRISGIDASFVSSVKIFKFTVRGVLKDEAYQVCALNLLETLILDIDTLDLADLNMTFTNPVKSLLIRINGIEKASFAIRNSEFKNIDLNPLYISKGVYSVLYFSEYTLSKYDFQSLKFTSIRLDSKAGLNSASSSCITIDSDLNDLKMRNIEIVQCNKPIYINTLFSSFFNISIIGQFAASQDTQKGPLLSLKAQNSSFLLCVFKNGDNYKVSAFSFIMKGILAEDFKLTLENCSFINNQVDVSLISGTISNAHYKFNISFTNLLFLENNFDLPNINTLERQIIKIHSFSKLQGYLIMHNVTSDSNLISTGLITVFFEILGIINSEIIFDGLFVLGNKTKRELFPQLISVDYSENNTFILRHSLMQKLNFTASLIYLGPFLDLGNSNKVIFINTTISDAFILPSSFVALSNVKTTVILNNCLLEEFRPMLSDMSAEVFFDLYLFDINTIFFQIENSKIKKIVCTLFRAVFNFKNGEIFVINSIFSENQSGLFGVFLIWPYQGDDGKGKTAATVINTIFQENKARKFGASIAVAINIDVMISKCSFLSNQLTDNNSEGTAIYFSVLDENESTDLLTDSVKVGNLTIQDSIFSPSNSQAKKFADSKENNTISLSSMLYYPLAPPNYGPGNKFEGVVVDSSFLGLIKGNPVSFMVSVESFAKEGEVIQVNYTNKSFTIDNVKSGSNVAENISFYFIDENSNIVVLNKSSPSIIMEFDSGAETDNHIFYIGSGGENYFQYKFARARFEANNILVTGPQGKSGKINVGLKSGLKYAKKNFYGVPFSEDSQPKPESLFSFNISFRNCIPGEIYKNSKCETCASGKYSLSIADGDCKTCDMTGVVSCEGFKITLAEGYWRLNETSEEIIYCSNWDFNCLGGFPGNECAEGHIGPLCLECDLYKTQWPESYSKAGKYSCGKCSQVSFNIIRIILVSIVTLISITISVKSTRSLMKRMMKTRLIQVFSRNLMQINRNLGAVYIKMFINYFQIISCIWTFEIKLPPELLMLPEFIGSPIEQLFYSIDCFIAKTFSADVIPLIYAKLLIIIFTPIIYLIIFLIIYMFYILLRRKKTLYKGSVVITSTLFIFLYLQPNVINYAISLLSCLEIGTNNFYIKADLTYKCYSEIYNYYSYSMVIPIFLFFAVIFPVFLLSLLYFNRDNLNKPSFRLRLGFIYNEYTRKGFYWEIVKMTQRISIILVLNFFDRYINLKGILILFILIVFGIWALLLKPYASKELDDLDKKSIFTCFFTILLGLLLYNNIFTPITYMALILAGVVNLFFLFNIFSKITFSYYMKFLGFLNDRKIPLLRTAFLKQITRHLSKKSTSSETHFLGGNNWERLRKAWANFKAFHDVYSGRLNRGFSGTLLIKYRRQLYPDEMEKSKMMRSNILKKIDEYRDDKKKKSFLSGPNKLLSLDTDIINLDSAHNIILDCSDGQKG